MTPIPALRTTALALAALMAILVGARHVAVPERPEDGGGDGVVRFGISRGEARKGKAARLCPGTRGTYAMAGRPCPSAASAQRMGVNLSGCEFADTVALCPNKADIDWYLAQGFTLLRIPVKDRHLTDPAMRAKVAASVRYAQTKGAVVILDRHDYRRHSAAEALAFWRPVLGDFSAATMIELANEPVKGYPAGSNPWMVSAQDTKETVALFRASRITNPILFGSPGYSAIFRFYKDKGPRFPAEGMGAAIDRVGGIDDPLGRTYFSGHRYFDKGGSGTSPKCTAESGNGDGGVARWAEALRKRGLKGYLTEFAFGSHRGIPASCAGVGANVMRSVRANADVILGTAVWGGGRAWPDSYPFKVEPKKGTRETAPMPAYVSALAER